MIVAAIQHDIVWEDRAANFRRLAPMIAAAAAGGASLVVLSEMFSVGFSLETDRIAEPVDGPSSDFLREQARRSGAWVVGSVPETLHGGSRPSNVAVIAGPGGELHRYAKIHPFSYAGEHERYEAGDATLTVTLEGVRVSPFVCYDLRFADEFWTLAPTTDLYVVPANWPSSRRAHWRALLVARAIENQAYVMGVNRVGDGGGLHYSGDSAVIDPWGETLVSAAGGEATLLTTVEPAEVVAIRTRFPFLADRRDRPSGRMSER